MSQISANSLANDACLRTIPTDFGLQPVCLQPEKRSQRHEQMTLLLRSRPHLGLFNAAALFDAPVVDFYPPSFGLPVVPRCFRYLKVVRRPIFRVSILGDCPKHFDESIALQMHDALLRGNLHYIDGPVPAPSVFTRRLLFSRVQTCQP
jgi:hypothetical protein